MMEDSTYDTDPTKNFQLFKNFFIKTDYIFDLDSTNKKFHHLIDHAFETPKLSKTRSLPLNIQFFLSLRSVILTIHPKLCLKLN